MQIKKGGHQRGACSGLQGQCMLWLEVITSPRQPEGRSRGCYSEGAYGCRERHERVVRTSCAALACIAEP
jgi:hypothetical protein